MKNYPDIFVPLKRMTRSEIMDAYPPKDALFKSELVSSLQNRDWMEVLKADVQNGCGIISIGMDGIKHVTLEDFYYSKACESYIKEKTPKPEYVGEVELKVDFVSDIQNKHKRQSFNVNHPLLGRDVIFMRGRQLGRTMLNKAMLDSTLKAMHEMRKVELEVCKILNKANGYV